MKLPVRTMGTQFTVARLQKIDLLMFVKVFQRGAEYRTEAPRSARHGLWKVGGAAELYRALLVASVEEAAGTCAAGWTRTVRVEVAARPAASVAT